MFMKRIKGSRMSVILSIFLAVAVVLAGCGGGQQASGGTGQASAKPGDSPKAGEASKPAGTQKWVHGILTAKGDIGFQQMGLEKGYYKEAGIDFQLMQFESDSTLVKALIAGEIDSIESTPSNGLVAISQGSDLRFVGATIPGLSHVLYTKKGINKVEDMKGKNIGISGPGALPQVLAQALLMEKNIDLEGVTWVNAGGDAARFKALIAGKVDGVVSGVEFKAEADKEKSVQYIADIGKILPNYLRYVFTVTGDTVKKKPELLTKVLEGEAKGIRYAIEHRDEELKLAAKVQNLQPDDPALTLVYDVHVKEKLLAPDLTFNPDSIKWMYELNKKLGKITKDFDVSKSIDLSFAEKATANLGKFTWPTK